jgi:hypothetical protein
MDHAKQYHQMESGDIVIFIPDDRKVPFIAHRIASRSQRFDSLQDLFGEYEFRTIDPLIESKGALIERIMNYPGYQQRIEENGVYYLTFDHLHLDMEAMIESLIPFLPFSSTVDADMVNVFNEGLLRDQAMAIIMALGFDQPIKFADGQEVICKNRMPRLPKIAFAPSHLIT